MSKSPHELVKLGAGARPVGLQTVSPAAREAHDRAVRAGQATYSDPETGYVVFTALTLASRGRCCGSGCRHCPYGPDEQRWAGRPGSSLSDRG